MTSFDGKADVRIGAPGPWAQRRIEFHTTSTYSSTPVMEPLNVPAPSSGDGASHRNVRGGSNSTLQQQQYLHNQHQHHNRGAGVTVKHGHSEPPSLPPSMPLQWTAPQKIGAGLSNLGNTCFLNSVLQCLTYTPPLAGYLLSGQHKASSPSSKRRVAGFCAFCALQEHVQQALASSGKVVSPQKLAKNLRSICRSFRMGRQEDSHEYMRYLLEALHKCCLPPDLAKNSNSKSSQERSLVYRIFGGQLRSQVRCTACSHCSNTYDPFLDLSLEIVRADSLTKALTRFTAVDVLDGDNKYKCPQCKKKVKAYKNFTVDLVPNILTIQFKRFSSTGGHGGKIDKKVDFGTTLDLKPFVSSGQDSVPKYKLFGVLVHSGWSTHSGHYYSFLRASSDIWHVFDDSRVRQVSEKTVLDQKAYMLFYVREVKRPSTSSSELAPAVKQALPRQVALFSKEKQISSDSRAPGMQPLCERPSQVLKDSLRKPVSELVPLKDSSASTSVQSKDREKTGHVRVISKPLLLQPVNISPTESLHHAVESTEGHRLKVNTPTVNGICPQVSSADPLVLNHSCSDEPSIKPCPLVEPAKENGHKKEVELSSPCTISGNPGFEDDWDEYYKKGWNPPGTTPQKFMKMLRVIPHTRRYYQARALPARRASKIVSNGYGEPENGHLEPSEALTANTKRPHAVYEDARVPKRQHRDSSRNGIPSTCMASEEFLANNEAMEIGSDNKQGSSVEEIRLQSRIETANSENGSLQENFAARKKVEDGQKMTEGPFVFATNGQLVGNAHVEVSFDHMTDSLKVREVHHSGVESRGGRDIENCRTSDGGDCGPNSKISTIGPSSEKGAEFSIKTVIPMSTNSLYGMSVPCWEDVSRDEQSVKEIETLLKPEKSGSFELDTWDVEYDRGRSKKLKYKSGRDPYLESIGNLNGISKLSNPFQTVGFAKKTGNGIKRGNGIGFKAGYGYGLKTGKYVGSGGSESV